MATWADVRRLALGLPETTERPSYGGAAAWRVRDKAFVWERPLRRADLAALGEDAPDGPVLAATVPDLGAKEALLGDSPRLYLTTPHFDGYPVVLARLDLLPLPDLEELVVEAWLAEAPRRLVQQYLGGR